MLKKDRNTNEFLNRWVIAMQDRSTKETMDREQEAPTPSAPQSVFIEDSFDLEAYRKETDRKKLDRYREKYQPLLNAASFLFMILAILGGLYVYRAVNFLLSLWRQY